MNLIEYSQLMGYVVAVDFNHSICLYYYANYTPSHEVIEALNNFYTDMALVLIRDKQQAINFIKMSNADERQTNEILNAFDIVSADDI